MIWFVLTALSWASPCTDPISTEVFEERLVAAEAAFHGLDAQGFHRQVDEAALELPCIDGRISPSLAARYHAVIGVRQLISREREPASLSLAASRSADPEFSFGEAFLPDGHIAFTLYEEAPAPSDGIGVPEPAVGGLLFDGSARLERPVSFPSILQITDLDGIVVHTGYLRSTDPMPAYTPRAEVEASTGTRLRAGWFVASAVSAVTSGVLYGASAASANRFAEPDPKVPFDQLERQRSVTNGLVIGSGVAGAAAIGTFATGFVPRR